MDDNGKICAIHQPNFFPWLGYFDKIAKCDRFVVLDHVQYPKTGGTWSNRVAINVQGRRHWITAPINRKSGVWTIAETTFQRGKWRDKIIKTLQASYAKAPCYKKHRDFLFELVNYGSDDLVEYNMNAVGKICDYLGIDLREKVAYSSQFGFESSSNELLADLTQAVGCDTYMAGGGAEGYQDISVFEKRKMGFVYQNFVHPHYHQWNTEEFMPGLSIIDALFNGGIDLRESDRKDG